MLFFQRTKNYVHQMATLRSLVADIVYSLKKLISDEWSVGYKHSMAGLSLHEWPFPGTAFSRLPMCTCRFYETCKMENSWKVEEILLKAIFDATFYEAKSKRVRIDIKTVLRVNSR